MSCSCLHRQAVVLDAFKDRPDEAVLDDTRWPIGLKSVVESNVIFNPIASGGRDWAQEENRAVILYTEISVHNAHLSASREAPELLHGTGRCKVGFCPYVRPYPPFLALAPWPFSLGSVVVRLDSPTLSILLGGYRTAGCVRKRRKVLALDARH
jgi:hypothetical protein